MGEDAVDDWNLVTWWGLVVEAYYRTSRLLEVGGSFDEVDLPGPWFEVLLRLLRTPGRRLTMGQLARETTLTSGGFTKLADRMVVAGLIQRDPSPDDRRVTYVVLTPAGERIGEEAQRRHVAALREHFLAPLGAERAERVAELMRVLRDAHAPV